LRGPLARFGCYSLFFSGTRLDAGAPESELELLLP
jgi:hypothetical protein